MKARFPSSRTPLGTALLISCLLASAAGILSAQSLTWNQSGSIAGPTDGMGNWLGGTTWWNGTTNVAWDNILNANTIATFGSGGAAGNISLTGGVSAGGIIFKAATVTTQAYALTGGTLTLATGSVIDLQQGSSSSTSAATRLGFLASSVIAGNNITIKSSATDLSLIRFESTANTWIGTLNLARETGTTGGLFVEVKTVGSISSLDSINVGTGTSLVLNYNSGAFNKPITIAGAGPDSRSALRFDQSYTLDSSISLATASQVGTNGSAVVAKLAGNITGNFTLTQSANGTIQVGTLVYRGTNAFGALTVGKGNAQIGEGGVGTSGNGLVTASGATSVISGTGTIKNGLYLNTTAGGAANAGVIRPGDDGGALRGTLTVASGNFSAVPTTALNVAQFQLAAPSGVSDRLNVTTGNVNLNTNSNISVLFDASYSTPVTGDSWTILQWGGTFGGGFSAGDALRTGADGASEGNLNLPDLTAMSGYAGQLWQVTLGANSLTATIVVPEPSSALIAGAGLGLLALRRRRA